MCQPKIPRGENQLFVLFVPSAEHQKGFMMSGKIKIIVLFLLVVYSHISTAQSGSVLLSPTGNQTVNQPSGTTLGVNSLNGSLNASLQSGSDICAAISSLSSGNNVVIPPGSYTYPST